MTPAETSGTFFLEAAVFFMVWAAHGADVKYNAGDDRVLVSIHHPRKLPLLCLAYFNLSPSIERMNTRSSVLLTT